MTTRRRKRPGLPPWWRRSKAIDQREHAVKRAIRRYGVLLSTEDYEALVKRIQRGEARLLFRESLRLSHYELEVEGRVCRVVYDHSRGTIVTFLPVETGTALSGEES